MKKLFLFVALFTWIGFSASAQETKKDERKDTEMKMDQNKHYWKFKDGKVFEVKDGKKTEMIADTQVGEVWIRTNGEVVLKDDKVVQLKNGQYVDEDGKIHKMMNKEKMSEKRIPPPVPVEETQP